MYYAQAVLFSERPSQLPNFIVLLIHCEVVTYSLATKRIMLTFQYYQLYLRTLTAVLVSPVIAKEILSKPDQSILEKYLLNNKTAWNAELISSVFLNASSRRSSCLNGV